MGADDLGALGASALHPAFHVLDTSIIDDRGGGEIADVTLVAEGEPQTSCCDVEILWILGDRWDASGGTPPGSTAIEAHGRRLGLTRSGRGGSSR